MSRWRPSKLNCLYVIGDVHGKYEQLKLIFNRILPLRKSDGGQDRLVMLGDYIDRHHDSHKVVDLLIKTKEKYGKQVILLRGNHEVMMLDAIVPSNTSGDYMMWMDNGGEKTLAGYLDRAGEPFDNPYVFPRARVKDMIPIEHLEFFSNTLVNSYETDEFIFAHAGWDPLLTQEQQNAESIWWGNSLLDTAKRLALRDDFIPWGKTITIGHFWKGPIVTDKFMMIDRSHVNELMVVEMRSKQAFTAKDKKEKLIKLDLDDYLIKPKKGTF